MVAAGYRSLQLDHLPGGEDVSELGGSFTSGVVEVVFIAGAIAPLTGATGWPVGGTP